MKKLLTLCLVTILVAVSQAQNIMTLHLKNTAPVEIETSRIDSMRWENGITLHIYFADQTSASYPLADFDHLSWSVPELPDDPVTVGDVELGTGEQYIINDTLTTVVAQDCTVEFSPTVADEDTKVVIRSATSAPAVYIESEDPDEAPIAISQNAKTVDVKLEGITDLDGTVEIRIPLRPSDGSIPSAAYYNETTKEWEPVAYSYDTATGEVIILTNHLSIYSAYEIKGEHTRNARMVFYSIPSHNVSTEEMAELALKIAAKKRDEMVSAVEECYGTISQIGLDIGYNAFNSTGMKVGLIEKYKDDLGTVSTLFSCYDIIRAGLKGDNETAGLNTMKLGLSQTTGALADAIGTGVMTAAMCGVAIIDYALNKMWETAWDDRKELYRRMYELYYQRRSDDGLTHHYMTAKDWYKKLLPVFRQGSPTVDGVKLKVEDIINDYVWEFWNLPESEFEMYWSHVTNLPWSYYGGLNETIKKDLADWHRNELHKTKFPIVFERIGEELELDNYELLKDGMKEYAEFMNQVIKLDISVTKRNPSDDIDLSKYKVRFKNLPSTITDPTKWETKISGGSGTIRFRLYAYTVENVQPTLEVVSLDGSEVLATQSFLLDEGTNKINIEVGGKQEGNLWKLVKTTIDDSGAHRENSWTSDVTGGNGSYSYRSTWMDGPRQWSGLDHDDCTGESISSTLSHDQLKDSYKPGEAIQLNVSWTYTDCANHPFNAGPMTIAFQYVYNSTGSSGWFTDENGKDTCPYINSINGTGGASNGGFPASGSGYLASPSLRTGSAGQKLEIRMSLGNIWPSYKVVYEYEWIP